MDRRDEINKQIEFHLKKAYRLLEWRDKLDADDRFCWATTTDQDLFIIKNCDPPEEIKLPIT